MHEESEGFITTIRTRAESPPARRRTVGTIAKRHGQRGAKERLVEAASELMRQRDTIAISIREVAACAGLNSSLIGYYFGNKDELLLSVIEHDILPIIDQMRVSAKSPLPAAERLGRHIEMIIDALYHYSYVNRLLMAIMRDFSPEQAKTSTDRLIRPLYEILSELVANGIERGEFRNVDPVFAYFIITGACAEMFSARAIHDSVFCLDIDNADVRAQFIAETSAIILNGLATQAEPFPAKRKLKTC